VAETESAFAHESLWEPHPLDEAEDEPPLGRVPSLYLGAASALHELEVPAPSSSSGTGAGSQSACRSSISSSRTSPSGELCLHCFLGEAGILLVAHTLAPSRWQEERLLEAVRANVANPTLELFWGSPSTMLAAQVMHKRTGAPVWLETWNASAAHLWAAWDDELWCQDLFGTRAHVLGPAHALVETSTRSRAATCSTESDEASSSGARSARLRGTPAAAAAVRNGRPDSRHQRRSGP
jgi:hypothetical protein